MQVPARTAFGAFVALLLLVAACGDSAPEDGNPPEASSSSSQAASSSSAAPSSSIAEPEPDHSAEESAAVDMTRRQFCNAVQADFGIVDEFCGAVLNGAPAPGARPAPNPAGDIAHQYLAQEALVAVLGTAGDTAPPYTPESVDTAPDPQADPLGVPEWAKALCGRTLDDWGAWDWYCAAALDGPGKADLTSELVGEWAVVIRVTNEAGACDSEKGDTYDRIITIEENGGGIRVEGLGGEGDWWTGYAASEVFAFSGSRGEDGGTTHALFEFQWAPYDGSGPRWTGLERWAWGGPGGLCPDGESTAWMVRP